LDGVFGIDGNIFIWGFVRSNFYCLVIVRDFKVLKGGWSDSMGVSFTNSQIRVLFLNVMGHACFVDGYAI